MKTCNCGGELLRHGVTRYKHDQSIIGIRYRCRDCNVTHTERMPSDEVKGYLYFAPVGRPTLKDWRYAMA
jgi:hypothetical protein